METKLCLKLTEIPYIFNIEIYLSLYMIVSKVCVFFFLTRVAVDYNHTVMSLYESVSLMM